MTQTTEPTTEPTTESTTSLDEMKDIIGTSIEEKNDLYSTSSLLDDEDLELELDNQLTRHTFAFHPLTKMLPAFSGFDGKRWIGKSHEVDGGSLCFKGREPTGRHPFGDNFKVVLTGVDEAQSRADFSIYFRVCFFCGCSPYIVGPIPFFSVTEKDPLFLGF